MPQREDLDVLVPLVFFPASDPSDRKTAPSRECHHLGTLVKDGFNQRRGRKIQRVRCSACQKRFGNSPDARDLLTYQTCLRQVIYEMIIARHEMYYNVPLVPREFAFLETLRTKMKICIEPLPDEQWIRTGFRAKFGTAS